MKLALLTANDVPALSIDVDTVNDVVTLSGKVAEEGEKTRAGEVAKGVEGVKNVKNILQVVPESRMKVVEKADAEIKDSVQKTLTTDKTLDGISVKSVDNGVVLLAGKATTTNAVKAVRAAREAPGVKRVVERDRAGQIGPPANPAGAGGSLRRDATTGEPSARARPIFGRPFYFR